MNVYEVKPIGERIDGNPYVGRGIFVGLTQDGKRAVSAYFIMGRSENSRNRVFTVKDGTVFTEPFDAAKVEDPSLIIYAAVRKVGGDLIVTNGDQTDTIARALLTCGGFREALNTRAFEPDAPNFTPRISAVLHLGAPKFTYEMSILKSIDEQGSDTARFTFDYPAKKGLGHFIHTYVTDGNPIPTFVGEPERVSVPDTPQELAQDIWEHLDTENRISLYVRYTDLASGEIEETLINKNGGQHD